MPGNSLLSHGETPHYHRRYGVSLLSSAWGQVGPPRSRRQANSLQVPNFNLKSGADTQSRTGDLTLTKGALYQLSHISTLNLMPGSSLLSKQALKNYFAQLNGQDVNDLYELVLAEVEQPLLDMVMQYTRGNQTRAALMMGINRGTLRKKLKKYGMN